MKILREEVVYDGNFIAVKRIHFQGRNQRDGVWEAVKRKIFGKIVAIFVITKNREVILEKAFRVPLNSYILEFPAGLMDKKDESPEQAIKRELLEETGYWFEGKPRLILEGPFNSGLLADEMMIFFADNAEKISEPRQDDFEDIKTVLVPLENLVDFVSSPLQGCKVDIKILTVLPILQKRGLTLSF